jgi:translation initiation factor IF-2
MTEAKLQRINKVAKELNVGIETIVDFLKKKRYNVENNPNAKISPEMYNELLKEFSSDSNLKKKSDLIDISTEKTRSITIDDVNSSKEQMSI